VDQAKAFDTIYHGFVRAAYKFFGVGDKFLDMMETLGTNRQARIILDGNKPSRAFNLGTGRPQGDPKSPLEFNAGEQILIFKIELDPGVKSIYGLLQVPRNLYTVDPELISQNCRAECNGETDKVDGFADDVAPVMVLEQESLHNLKLILIDFAGISGLHCNLDKTFVMPIGAARDTGFVEDLGFKITDKITFLGFIVSNNGLDTTTIFNSLYTKIGKIITMWSTVGAQSITCFFKKYEFLGEHISGHR
jgi:Reverse transcriptase (RNA-dependent DNA polymerase)